MCFKAAKKNISRNQNRRFTMVQNAITKKAVEANVKVNIKLIKKYKIKLIKKFNVVFPENVTV